MSFYMHLTKQTLQKVCDVRERRLRKLNHTNMGDLICNVLGVLILISMILGIAYCQYYVTHTVQPQPNYAGQVIV